MPERAPTATSIETSREHLSGCRACRALADALRDVDLELGALPPNRRVCRSRDAHSSRARRGGAERRAGRGAGRRSSGGRSPRSRRWRRFAPSRGGRRSEGAARARLGLALRRGARCDGGGRSPRSSHGSVRRGARDRRLARAGCALRGRARASEERAGGRAAPRTVARGRDRRGHRGAWWARRPGSASATW
jgi:hypothetical protein